MLKRLSRGSIARNLKTATHNKGKVFVWNVLESVLSEHVPKGETIENGRKKRPFLSPKIGASKSAASPEGYFFRWV